MSYRYIILIPYIVFCYIQEYKDIVFKLWLCAILPPGKLKPRVSLPVNSPLIYYQRFGVGWPNLPEGEDKGVGATLTTAARSLTVRRVIPTFTVESRRKKKFFIFLFYIIYNIVKIVYYYCWIFVVIIAVGRYLYLYTLFTWRL